MGDVSHVYEMDATSICCLRNVHQLDFIPTEMDTTLTDRLRY